MVVWAPGGLSGIILAHAPVLRAGLGGRLVPSYAAMLPGVLLALAGTFGLAELAFRLQSVRNGASPRPVFGLALDPESVLPWLVAAVLLLAGAWLLRRAGPAAKEAWQEASTMAQAH